MTNLELLTQVEKQFQLKEQRELGVYFVGVLSTMVDESIWRKALDASVRGYKRLQEFTAQEATNVPHN